MSKNNEPVPPQGQDGHPPRLLKEGYQPKASQSSPQKPPSNPPNKGSSGKK
jgi:hypothetical protein